MLQNVFLLIAAVLIINPLSIYSQTDKLSKIKPIESKLEDVEAIFGKSEKRSHMLTYETNDGKYTIFFSYGPCELGKYDWNVPEWTVVKIYYTLYKSLKIKSLGINLKKLKKERNELTHTPSVQHYTDVYNGITYSLQKDFEINAKVVSGIKMVPGSKYKHLRCK
jgi:hypothetical protein